MENAAGAREREGESVEHKLEAYTLEPHEGWTHGAIKGWSEGECIPFRYTLENGGSSSINIEISLYFDNESRDRSGIVDFEAFDLSEAAGSVEGPYFDGDGEGRYDWSLTVPGDTTYVLEWCARLSQEAADWPGASMHVRARGGEDGRGGENGEIPIMVSDQDQPTDQVTNQTIICPSANAGPDRYTTLGQSVTIGGSPSASGGSGNYTYLWSPTEGLDDPTSSNPMASPTTNTTYTLFVIDYNGCINSSSMMITVLDAPACGIDGPKVICEDDLFSTFYYVGEDTSTANFSFLWQVDGVDVGVSEEIEIEWDSFEFGIHNLTLDLVKEYPNEMTATSRCEHEVIYVESPTASIRMM